MTIDHNIKLSFDDKGRVRSPYWFMPVDVMPRDCIDVQLALRPFGNVVTGYRVDGAIFASNGGKQLARHNVAGWRYVVTKEVVETWKLAARKFGEAAP